MWRKEDSPGIWVCMSNMPYSGTHKALSVTTLYYKVRKRADGNSGWRVRYTYTECPLCSYYQKSSTESQSLKDTKLKCLTRVNNSDKTNVDVVQMVPNSQAPISYFPYHLTLKKVIISTQTKTKLPSQELILCVSNKCVLLF